MRVNGRIRVLISSFAALSVLLLTACAPAAPPAETPEAAPVSLPVPDGCPTAEEFGKAWVGDSTFADAIDAALLTGETTPGVPPGGCGYATGEVGTSGNSDEQFRWVQVWYFNLDIQGKSTIADITAWASSAGGVPAVSTDPVSGETTTDTSGYWFDLPDDFTGWTGSGLSIAGVGGRNWSWDEEIVPAHTQGASGRIEFALDAERVEALIAASDGGNAGQSADPTTALSQGRAAAFEVTMNVTDDDGYTADIHVSGRLQPFTSEVENSPPGQFQAVSSSTVGGSFTNTTAGRKTNPTGVAVIALYPLDSAACTAYNGVSLEGTSWQDTAYCTIDLGTLRSGELPVDGTTTVEQATRKLRLGDFPEAGDALAQLNSPVSIYAFFGGSPGRTNPAWSSDEGCRSSVGSSGQWLVVMPGWPEVICK